MNLLQLNENCLLNYNVSHLKTVFKHADIGWLDPLLGNLYAKIHLPSLKLRIRIRDTRESNNEASPSRKRFNHNREAHFTLEQHFGESY